MLNELGTYFEQGGSRLGTRRVRVVTCVSDAVCGLYKIIRLLFFEMRLKSKIQIPLVRHRP